LLALQLLGWAGSALLVYSVLQTRILRLRVLNGVASAVLAVFNAAIAVWPMVAMNLVLTGINAFYVVRMLRRRHDVETFEVIKVSPEADYLKYLLTEFHANIQRFYPGFSVDDAIRTHLGFLILQGAETVGIVLARDVGDESAQVDLDYVLPRYQGFRLGEFVYRSGGPLATLGYRRAIAPRMQNAGDYLTDVGFRSDGKNMVRDLV
jgi:hypothetical protein